MKQWLPEDDLAYFIMDIVHELDLSAICESYNNDKGGQPPFNPTMMTSLLLYAYCIGIPSSRKIEKATYYQVPFRVITADQHPDHQPDHERRQRVEPCPDRPGCGSDRARLLSIACRVVCRLRVHLFRYLLL